jgi:hypothetical protein
MKVKTYRKMSNRDQNRQFRDAVREIERILRHRLTITEVDRLHREVSGMGYSFGTIVQVGLAMFG